MYVLDTNIVSELRKFRSGRANAGVVNWAASVRPSELYISAITVMELEQGILLAERRDSPQGELLRRWFELQVMPAFAANVLPVDSAVALRCAHLHVPDRKSERDALIAATAIVHSMIIVTRNVADFKHTGARLLNPFN